MLTVREWSKSLPSVIRKRLHPPISLGRKKGKNHTEKTVSHSFLLCIAKMANLSQYCTPLGWRNSTKFNRFRALKIRC
jgi:hypothetical protein